MKRYPKSHIYYYIKCTGEVGYTTEQRSKDDDARYNIGNYYSAEGIREAVQVVKKKGFIGWLKGLAK